MKKIYLTLIAALILASCQKSKVETKTNPVISLAGQTYVLYRVQDTTFNQPPATYPYRSITTFSAYGDTSYLNPGNTQYYRVEPDPNPEYNAANELADTLAFTTSTSGNDNSNFGSSAFTYSFSTHTYTEPPVQAGFSSKIFQVDANTVEVLSLEEDGIEDHRGLYYRKPGSVYIPVLSVSLNKGLLTLEQGDTAHVAVSYFPFNATNPSVSWSSSDTTVATINSGVITAKTKGTTNILATNTVSGKGGLCLVTVKSLADLIRVTYNYLVMLGNTTEQLNISLSSNSVHTVSITGWDVANSAGIKFVSGTISDPPAMISNGQSYTFPVTEGDFIIQEPHHVSGIVYWPFDIYFTWKGSNYVLRVDASQTVTIKGA